MARQFLPAVFLCVFTHIIRTVYEILKHKKLIKPDKLSFIIIFINMALLWVSWFLLCSRDAHAIDIPIIIRYFGLLLIASGIILFITALLTIKTLETYEGDLITKGIYSRIRHPMYLGFVLWLIGGPIYFGGVYSIIIAIPFILNVMFWRYLEEKELLERFSGYNIYSKRTIF